MLLAADVKRLELDLEKLATFTATPGEGVTRFSFTREDRLAREYIKEQMLFAGLTVSEDAAGTVVGRRAGRNTDGPVVMVGSHFDSVKNGGPFDGPAGIATALEIARLLSEHNIITELPLEFVALIEEEGGRFGGGLFGSRAMTGKVSTHELATFKDAQGITIAAAMTDFGFNPNNISQAIRQPHQVKAFLELHIEQGPVLEAAQIDVGIVDTVVGIAEYEVTLTGRPDHAGTTPMRMRADALVAAADIIKLANKLAIACGEGTVATVGTISAYPGAANIVPGQVKLTLDIRSVEQAHIDFIADRVKELLTALPQTHSIYAAMTPKVTIPPVKLSPIIGDIMTTEASSRAITTRSMLSGAGHDAMVMASIADVGLIFVPSKNGRSHCPEEWTDYEQLKKGVDVMLGTLLRLAETR